MCPKKKKKKKKREWVAIELCRIFFFSLGVRFRIHAYLHPPIQLAGNILAMVGTDGKKRPHKKKKRQCSCGLIPNQRPSDRQDGATEVFTILPSKLLTAMLMLMLMLVLMLVLNAGADAGADANANVACLGCEP
jgi:hypothetical protein